MIADLDRAAIEEVNSGSDPRSARSRRDGSATLTYGSPARLAVAVKAKQANVDALLRRKGEDGVAPARALAFLPALGRRSGAGGVDGDRRRSLGRKHSSARRRCRTFRGDYALRPRRAAACAFGLGLPGRSRLRGEGDLETGAAGKFEGMIDFESEDYRASPQLGEARRAGFAANLASLARRWRIAAHRSRAISKPPPSAFRDAM